jgi:membrane fusion protein, copper/silver efflux system
MRAISLAFLIVVLIALGGAGGFYAARHTDIDLFAPALFGDESSAAATPDSGSQSAENDREILYYRNPMGLPDTSPVPKKDSMGMDYIPVYADESASEDEAGTVRISPVKVQRTGVRTEPAALRVLAQPIHVSATVQMDETRLRSITMRAEGFIEEVYAGATGQHVKKGEPLFRIYSPAIVQAQVDYRIAASQGSKEQGARKLRNYGVPESHIAALDKKVKMPLAMDWPAPVDGVLMTKNLVVGQRVMPGDELYRLADVSQVWVIANVPEQDIGRVKLGDSAIITVRALPNEQLVGKVAFILPELDAETRSAQVRIELPNPEHRLIHEMYADVEIATSNERSPVLTVPASAIIDSGLRQVAIVEQAPGRFVPRPVKLGRRGGGYVEVIEGLAEGDQVVTRANFLIDAESNLKTALEALVSNDGAAQ